MRLEQQPGSDVAAEAKNLLLPDSCSVKLHVLDDVMQGDVGAITESARERRRPQSGKRGHRMLLGREGGKYQVEPDHVGLQLSDCSKQAQRGQKTVELPAADHAKTRQLGLRLRTQGLSGFVGGELVVRQFIRKNGQFDRWISLQLPRDVERVFVQLAAARRECRD